MFDDGDGGSPFGSDGNKKQDNGCLQNAQTDYLFDNVSLDDDAIQADQHQQDVDPPIDS
jgi:hypothetical protein